MNSPSPSTSGPAWSDGPGQSCPGPACPRCNGPLLRVRRRVIDLVISLFVPVRRYRCDALGCTWEGNLRADRDAPVSGDRREP